MQPFVHLGFCYFLNIPDEEYFRIKNMSENEYDAYCGKNREEYDKDNKEE